MENKFTGTKIFIICVTGILVFITLFVLFIKHDNKIELNEKYNELTEPVTEYLESKYIEEMIIKEGVTLYDDAYSLFAYPKNNPEIEFRAIDWGRDIVFKDDYLESYSEWEAKTIIDSIVKNYFTSYYCYTILTYEQKTKDILLEYYNTNKRHLSWQDGNHLDELQFAGIRLYGSDENLVEKNVMEPVLSDVLKLDFIVQRVTFYLYENEEEKGAIKSYIYEYKDGEYHLRSK